MNKLMDVLVRESQGTFLTLTFTKKNGDIRSINGRIGVEGASYRSDTKAGDPYLLIWECKTRTHKRINLNTIERIASRNAVLYTKED